MKTSKKSAEPSVLDFFSNRKRPAGTPSNDFVSKRIKEEREEKEERNSINLKKSDQQKLPSCCVDCKKKDKVIEALENNNKILQNTNSALLKDNKSLKHLLSKCTKVNLEKDLKIKQLNKQQQQDSVNPSIFTNYANVFEDSELKSLRSIPFHSSKDSSFVLLVLRLIYKNNLSTLNCRTATSSKVADKTPITPEKKALISGLYFERLDSLQLSDFDLNSRKAKLNEHTMTGIHNIRKSLGKSLQRQSN